MLVTSPIPTINVFLLLHSLLKGVSDAKYKVKASFSSRNNTTSANSVIYAQKWAWPEKEPTELARGVGKIEPHHFS